MKDIKPITIKLTQWDVEVNPYLSYAQIQGIAKSVMEFDTWAERQANMDALILHYATNISTEDIERIGVDAFEASGLMDDVRHHIGNLYMIDECIEYHESVKSSLARIAKHINGLDSSELITAIKGLMANGEQTEK